MNTPSLATPVVKVCGIQRVWEAEMCVSYGANTLGFLVGLTHEATDEIAPENARHIIQRLPASTQKWMVTHLLDAKEISQKATYIRATGIQIHDDLSDEGINFLRKKMPQTSLIKAIHVTNSHAVEKALHYNKMEAVNALLLDSRTSTRLGGTGQTHDWNISREIVNACTKPVILAGGLKPENVQLAIEQVNPAGIDANSGLEDDFGFKDSGKVEAYAACGLKIPPRP
ncbi:MAG: phosphoribosylanthranilate isomerase [Proteobacteria bacterium]|nr:phosphoribosylanthranilate isomerase [Pseudomonadota bacterium]